jgi:hypothetical protein
MQYEQRVIIRFLYNEEVPSKQITTRLRAQYDEDGYKLRTVQDWCTKSRMGRNELKDEKRGGRPVIDYVDTQILVCFEKEPFRSATSLAEELKVSVRTVLRCLHDSLRMKNYHLRWSDIS